jgi:prophage regulatory protein
MAETLPLAAKRYSRQTSDNHARMTTPSVQPPSIRILRLSQVMEATGLRKTSIYELQAAGRFPMRVQITGHSVGWIDSEVQAWLCERIARRHFNRS